MKTKLWITLAFAALLLSACKQPQLYSVDGVSTERNASIVRIREGSMLLRGLDGSKLDVMKVSNPFSDFLFALRPGTHSLWGMNIQGGHALFPENLRCYVISNVELKAGVVYRLDEDKELPRALLRREDTGEQIAVGALVDQKSAYTDSCNWK
jgi:hypothetical protein